MEKKDAVLVYFSCYKKIPQIGWLINNKYLFFTVLQAGESKIMADLVFGEDSFPGS